MRIGMDLPNKLATQRAGYLPSDKPFVSCFNLGYFILSGCSYMEGRLCLHVFMELKMNTRC